MTSTPWLKFYPRDWRGDQALRVVDIAARGLWIEMLCVMHEASPYGHLILGGQPVSNDVLARLAGAGAEEVARMVADLESAGVFSRTRKGVIYSRRMVKDRQKAEIGRKFVSKRWKQDTEGIEENTTPNRSPSRIPITQIPEARSQKEKIKPALARFDEFWNVCPKKTAKGAAERAWLKATSLAEPDVLIAAMRRYGETQSGKDGAFTKTPGPWLNEKRWLDEGIAPVVVDEGAEMEARAAWHGDASKLVDEIGVGAFKAYFEAAKFEPGPPARIRVDKQFVRDMIARKYAGHLKRLYGEFVLEAA